MGWPWSLQGRHRDAERRRKDVLHLLLKRLKECEEALASDPDDVDALFTKGVFLARIAEYGRSLECLERAMILDPTYPGLGHLRASLRRRVGASPAGRGRREPAAGP